MPKRLWAGLDVGCESTSLCVIDDSGCVLQKGTCSSSLADIHDEIRWLKRRRHATVGLEASNGASLARGLRTLGYAIDLYETRQLSKFLRARRNKTDAGDAIGIAEAGRIGASRVSKVHLKSLECQSLQSRLTIRRHLIRHRVATLNLICRQINLFGGRVKRSASPERTRENVEVELRRLFRGKSNHNLASNLYWLLDHYSVLVSHQAATDRELACFAAENEVCRRFMKIPGVGPMCALGFYATVDDPHRFRRSRDVGSYLGLTPTVYQSGLTLRVGRISKMGNRATRALLVQSAMSFMRFADENEDLRLWASKLEERRGRNPTKVALARKLAVLMVAMWKNSEDYRPRQGSSLMPENLERDQSLVEQPYLSLSSNIEGKIGPRMAHSAHERAYLVGVDFADGRSFSLVDV